MTARHVLSCLPGRDGKEVIHMAMSEEKRNEIAYLIFRNQIQQEGIRLFPDKLYRMFPDLSKRINVPGKELLAFSREFLSSLLDETFDKA